MLKKIGITIAVAQPAAKFLEGVFDRKNFPPVVELEWSGPFRKNFSIEYFYMDWKIANGSGIVRVDNDAVFVSLTTQRMQSGEHRVNELIHVGTLPVGEIKQTI